jgi:capsular polysaccharide export protein
MNWLFSVLVEYPIYNLPHTCQMQVPLVTPEHVLEHICKLQQTAEKSPIQCLVWDIYTLARIKNEILGLHIVYISR